MRHILAMGIAGLFALAGCNRSEPEMANQLPLDFEGVIDYSQGDSYVVCVRGVPQDCKIFIENITTKFDRTMQSYQVIFQGVNPENITSITVEKGEYVMSASGRAYEFLYNDPLRQIAQSGETHPQHHVFLNMIKFTNNLSEAWGDAEPSIGYGVHKSPECDF